MHGTTIINNNFDKFYVLAVLNSQLISWFYKNTSPESNKVFAQIKIDILKKLPIPNIEKSLQNNIVKITGQIIDKKKISADSSKLEKKIDDIILSSLKLNEKEIDIIKNL